MKGKQVLLHQKNFVFKYMYDKICLTQNMSEFTQYKIIIATIWNCPLLALKQNIHDSYTHKLLNL